MTLAATLAGFYAGVTLGQFLEDRTAGDRHPHPLTELILVRSVVIGLALVTLLVGELLPRRIALHWPEQIATRLARPMIGFSILAGPLVRSLGAADRFPGPARWESRSTTRPPTTPEEIKSLLWEGTQAGVFEEAEHEIFKCVFRFCDRRARA